MKKLSELASIERAQKDKIYPSGCTLIPLSAASHKLIRYLEEAEKVDSRYAVAIPKGQVIPKFLHIIIKMAAPRFFHTYQTGMNLQIDILLEYYRVKYIPDVNKQREIAQAVLLVEQQERLELQEIERLKALKKRHMKMMFP